MNTVGIRNLNYETMNTKICEKCKQEKPISEFCKDRSRKDGFQVYCIDCVKKYHKIHYKNNKEKINKQCKEYYQKNRKRLNKLNKEYYKSHQQENKEYQKQYREVHRLETKEYMKKYQSEHKKERKLYIKIHHKKILEQTRQKIEEIQKQTLLPKPKTINYDELIEKLKTDINFKIKHYLRSALTRVLKGKHKYSSVMLLVNCSIEQLKSHLSLKFHNREDGLEMTFDNYGLWHIDHIRPCASFDLSKSEEQNKCFHYTNLQPLWAKDNLIKGIKISEEK